ncbi:Zn-dependent hydrolase [Phormidium sp. CLA17]|uniref:Zn-dependent hydrolase n=1 Tax=Leptolyngbya sp. Cla-17 TaxID=2803751 RepID=UPI00149130AE|nr:Zn-dependent hydrolase [Leptolyngbya sp. Cla-17]MBM0744039.1 Zn-dependent hydrolase [Leptolyngbya sp. Cla-17]
MIATVPLVVNGDRLNRSIDELAEVGKLENGGVCRIAFTTEDLLARRLVQSWMLDAGMTVRIDAAGNMIGRYAGLQTDAPALATGSHIDTVPVAGRYDGCLGVLAGLEVVRTLNENKIRLNHPLEVIVFTDEERSVIGSKTMAGEIKEAPEHYCRLDGTPIQPCLEKIGGNWEQIALAKRDRKDIAAFVELHVEQGGVLEHRDVLLGVVTGVVGQYRFAVDVLGRPNHAGTTPMHLRKDALFAAAQMVVAINKIAVDTPGDQVATVGFMNVHPNATNTIAGKVDFRIDLRDLSQQNLEYLKGQIEEQIRAIAAETGTEITMRQTLHILPTLAASPIMNVIEEVCQEMHLGYTHLPSRAGHDAQEIGRITDMGMIFVPSRAGISHSKDEYTAPNECTQGANVLLKTFLKLDRLYD